MNAMILAAGLGTRLKPFTDKHPKALAVVNGKSVLQRNIEYLFKEGVTGIIVNVHHFASQIIDEIGKNGEWKGRVTISNEEDEVLETGGGILKASWFLQQTEISVVMNADVLTDLPLKEMIQYHRQHRPLATLATTTRTTSRYLLFDEHNKLCGWKNTKTGEQKGSNGDQKAFSGIQVLSKQIFELIPFTGKFSMIDVYLALCDRHRILSFDQSQWKMLDIGTMEKLEQANAQFK